MANREVLLSGIGEWCKFFRPEEYRGKLLYSCNLYLDDTSKALFRDLKLKNGFREGTFGEYVILRRDHAPKVWTDPKTGKDKVMATGGAPELVNLDGTPFDTNKLIGNGSKITVKLEVYESKAGAGSRIQKVRVDELVEYTPEPTTANANEGVPF